MQKYKQESKQFNSNRQKNWKSINYSTTIQPYHCALILWPEATNYCRIQGQQMPNIPIYTLNISRNGLKISMVKQWGYLSRKVPEVMFTVNKVMSKELF